MGRDSQNLLKIEMTSEYLVLTCIDTILCVSLKDIEKANPNKDEIGATPYIDRLHEKGLIKAKLINLSEMFDSDSIGSGLFVNVVSKTQLEEVERETGRKNVIQISTMTNLLMWDIDKEEEVTCLQGYSQFINVKKFVRTGLNYYIPNLKKDNKVATMRMVKAITHNESNTFFCLPSEKSIGNIGTCFKLFSVLDLHEFNFISKKVSKKEYVKLVDSETVTAEIYGVSIFQQFL
jgi:hypothetical protein